jgi:hypothetical protein
MSLKNAKTTLLASLALLFVAALASPASAQRAESWVDIRPGGAGAGASADGMFKFAKSKSSSKNGVQFGQGLAVGAGPNGISVSNSIGAGAGPIGVAHNVNLSIGKGGTHVSHGGVVSQGGNRRVTTGGSTGVQSNGRVYGGSNSTGYGNKTHAWSRSHTRNAPTNYVPLGQGSANTTQVYQGQSYRSTSPSTTQFRQPRGRSFGGFRIR